MKRVFILAGLPGSGKSTAADFFRMMSIPIVRMGDITSNLLKERAAVVNEENERAIRDSLRNENGQEIYAKFTVPDVQALLETHPTVVIEGMRSPEELNYFRDQFSTLSVLYIDASTEIRHKRLSKRKDRPLDIQEAEKRDQWEIQTMHSDQIKKQADYVIHNESTTEEFYKELKKIITI